MASCARAATATGTPTSTSTRTPASPARGALFYEEVEGVSAISLAGRGAETTIATADSLAPRHHLRMCGGCVDVCPTNTWGRRCPWCGRRGEREAHQGPQHLQLLRRGLPADLNVDPEAEDGRGRVVKVWNPPAGTTTNDGNLCVKGRFAYDFIHHEDRITSPLVRNEAGELVPTSWENALSVAAAGLHGVSDRYGPNALGFVSSSRCTMEENYLVQKLSRAVFKTNNVHQCAAT